MSAIRFNLDQSKILSSGNGLRRGILQALFEKEKMFPVKTSMFFSNGVFFGIKDKSYHLMLYKR